MFCKVSGLNLQSRQPPIQWYRVRPPGMKRQESEFESSPPSADVMNEWSYTFSPPVCLHGTHRVNVYIDLL